LQRPSRPGTVPRERWSSLLLGRAILLIEICAQSVMKKYFRLGDSEKFLNAVSELGWASVSSFRIAPLAELEFMGLGLRVLSIEDSALVGIQARRDS
jgi:hypothetical protein